MISYRKPTYGIEIFFCCASHYGSRTDNQDIHEPTQPLFVSITGNSEEDIRRICAAESTDIGSRLTRFKKDWKKI